MQATRESIAWFFETPTRLLNSGDIKEILERAEQLELGITKTTASLTGMPGGGGADRSTKLARYMDSKAQVESVEKLLNKAKEDNLKLINSAVISDRQKKLLTLRYVKIYTYPKIASCLGICLRQVYRDRDAALDSCAAYVTLEKPDYAKSTLVKPEI